MKASRYLTHIRRLRDVADGMARLGERIEPLVEAERLLATLWQLPANFHRDDERLAAALDEMPPGRHAFEPRHPSWFADDVADRCASATSRSSSPTTRARRCPRRRSPRRGTTCASTTGIAGGAATTARASSTPGRGASVALRGDVLAYFNNDWEAFAPRNAEGLLERLRR